MKQITLSLVLSFFYLSSISGQITILPVEFDTIRYLTEINADNQADAYPWLSDDGLRIYFVQRPDSLPVSLMYYAERNSVQDEFSDG